MHSVFHGSSAANRVQRFGVVEKPNNMFKALAMLARTSSTPRLIAHGIAIVSQTALRTSRPLTRRYVYLTIQLYITKLGILFWIMATWLYCYFGY